jgi:hypothetical protein
MHRRIRRPSAAMVVALLALFVSLGGSAMAAFVVSSNSQVGPNTIYGANKPAGANDNIVDGSVAPADIKPNSIAGKSILDGSLTGVEFGDGTISGAKLTKASVPATKLPNNSVTGTQVNEDTLGPVPEAHTVDGYAVGSFYHKQATGSQATSDCVTAAQTWVMCAPVTLTVPAGHLYYVTVISSITANPGNANNEILACPSTDGPSCISGSPDRMTFNPNQYGNWTATATKSYYEGTYQFNTGMKWPFTIPANSEAHTQTTIIVSDYRQGYFNGN